MKHFLIMGLALTIFSMGSTALAEESKLLDKGPIDFKMESQTTQLTAMVEAIDYNTRIVTLKGPEGNIITTKVDDDVENLDKVKKGDKVDIEFYKALALKVHKNDPKKNITKTTTTTTWNTINKHKKPIKVEAEEIRQTTDITAVDPQKGTVTLVGVKNTPVEVKVKDPKNLEGVKAGDQLDITWIESVAVDVLRK